MATPTVLPGSFLGVGLAGAASVGVSVLVTEDKNYKALRMAIDADIQETGKSITALQGALSSLAEAVLQNRRGLDFLFLQLP
jgi:hypothetical protein